MAHIPVLLKETIDGLSLKEGDIFVDATLGDGGHSEEICRRFKNKITIVGIDLNRCSLDSAGKRLQKCGCQLITILGNFRGVAGFLLERGIMKADAVLFDLGWSSSELEDGRGLSFMKDEPLIMTLKEPSPGDLTAKDILECFSEKALQDIFFAYGEERFGKRIARAIVEEREKREIATTFILVEIIRRAVPGWYRRGKIHFATKTFQSLRIAVNDEFQALKEGLSGAWSILSPLGRIAAISFHSGEDRIVKRFMKEIIADESGIAINKKPITPTDKERKINPSGRSAKLRIIEKNDDIGKENFNQDRTSLARSADRTGFSKLISNKS